MKTLSIIPCGRKKIWDVRENYPNNVPAKEVYLSAFHRFCREYAEKFTDDWVVISGKHGFLYPNDIVPENYNITFGMRSDDIISIQELKKHVKEKRLDQYDELVILTGKKYNKYIQQAFGEDFPKTYPLANYKGIGYMQKALKNSIEKGEPIK